MPLPPLDSIPSELTFSSAVERHLLEDLDDPRAWAMAPSRIQESDLGYDARFQGTKLALVQYKRPKNFPKRGVSVKIDPDQHAVLNRVAERLGPCSTYYAFGVFESLHDLDDAHLHEEVLKRSLFVDTTAFPVGVTTLRGATSGLTPPRRWTAVPRAVAFQDRAAADEPTSPDVLTGRQWIDLFRDCWVGVKIMDDLGAAVEELEREEGAGRVRFLVSRAAA